jgi:hypothetical protein
LGKISNRLAAYQAIVTTGKFPSASLQAGVIRERLARKEIYAGQNS